jgi:large subunit ribosomal protein L5
MQEVRRGYRLKGGKAVATRIKEKYLAEAVPALKQKFGYKNAMQVPKLCKIVINMGLGDCKDNAKAMEQAVSELATISGQKPMITKAKKSIANFKVRAGQNVGAKVTLRGARMEEFFDKLVSVALPRVRDFHGVSAKAFDGRGNYALGIQEQLLFPEIEYDKVEKIRGMEMIFVTTANTDEECKELLAAMGMPYEKA